MALDRLLPVSTTPGAVDGDAYMDAVQEEVTGLWDRAIIKLSSVSGTNTITATFVPALTGSLVDGMHVLLRPAATNTGAVTLNGDAVKDGEGSALAAGALRIGGAYHLVWVSALSAWCVIGYFPAAAVSSGTKLIATQTASSSGSIDFVHGVSGVVLDDTYDAYEVRCTTVKPATDDVEFWLRIGTGAGPTYQTTGYDHAIAGGNTSGGTSYNGTAQSRIILAGNASAAASVGNAANECVNTVVRFQNPEATEFPMFQIFSDYVQANATTANVVGNGRYTTATAITAIRFMFETGNIASGRFTLYGFVKA